MLSLGKHLQNAHVYMTNMFEMLFEQSILCCSYIPSYGDATFSTSLPLAAFVVALSLVALALPLVAVAYPSFVFCTMYRNSVSHASLVAGVNFSLNSCCQTNINDLTNTSKYSTENPALLAWPAPMAVMNGSTSADRRSTFSTTEPMVSMNRLACRWKASLLRRSSPHVEPSLTASLTRGSTSKIRRKICFPMLALRGCICRHVSWMSCCFSASSVGHGLCCCCWCFPRRMTLTRPLPDGCIRTDDEQPIVLIVVQTISDSAAAKSAKQHRCNHKSDACFLLRTHC